MSQYMMRALEWNIHLFFSQLRGTTCGKNSPVLSLILEMSLGRHQREFMARRAVAHVTQPPSVTRGAPERLFSLCLVSPYGRNPCVHCAIRTKWIYCRNDFTRYLLFSNVFYIYIAQFCNWDTLKSNLSIFSQSEWDRNVCLNSPILVCIL
jgi:hypothetical protein